MATADHTALARPLPNNLDAERSVLGAILLDNHALNAAIEKLRPEDFFLDQHRRIFIYMIELGELQQAIDLVTLSDHLHRKGELEAAGGAAYISQLMDGVPRVSNLEHYTRIIKEKAVRRNLIHATHAIQQKAFEDEDDTDAILDDAAHTIVEVRGTRSTPQQQEHVVPDLDDTALDGRLGEICAHRLNDLPLAYGYPALLAAASVRVPPTTSIRTNLFVCLVGPVGSAKSQSVERSYAALGVGAPEIEPLMAGSGESMLGKIQGTDGSPRLISVDELSHLLDKAQIKGASFPALLNRAYYNTCFDLTIAGGKQIAVNCRLGIVGGIVEENFQASFGSSTVFGLHDRFVFGLCPKPFNYSFRPFEGAPESCDPCRVIVAPDVWEARDEWLQTIPGLTGRHAEHALRVAAICASWDRRQLLEAKDLGPAKVFARYQAKVRLVLQPNPGENLDARCAFAITTALDGTWTAKRALYRKIHGYRFGPGAFDRACQTLEFAGEITSMKKGKQRLLRTLGEAE